MLYGTISPFENLRDRPAPRNYSRALKFDHHLNGGKQGVFLVIKPNEWWVCVSSLPWIGHSMQRIQLLWLPLQFLTIRPVNLNSFYLCAISQPKVGYRLHLAKIPTSGIYGSDLGSPWLV